MTESGSPASITAAKAKLRRELRLRARQPVDPLIRHRQTADLCRWMRAWLKQHLPPPATLTLFGGLPDEADLVRNLLPLLTAEGYQCALFAIGPEIGRMEAHRVPDASTLRRGVLNVWEPIVHDETRLDPCDVQVVFVPGQLFCPETGIRLGRGGGYFDRYLSRVPASTWRIGIGFESQLSPSLPKEAHDIPVQWLITEQQIRRIPKI